MPRTILIRVISFHSPQACSDPCILITLLPMPHHPYCFTATTAGTSSFTFKISGTGPTGVIAN